MSLYFSFLFLLHRCSTLFYLCEDVNNSVFFCFVLGWSWSLCTGWFPQAFSKLWVSPRREVWDPTRVTGTSEHVAGGGQLDLPHGWIWVSRFLGNLWGQDLQLFLLGPVRLPEKSSPDSYLEVQVLLPLLRWWPGASGLSAFKLLCGHLEPMPEDPSSEAPQPEPCWKRSGVLPKAAGRVHTTSLRSVTPQVPSAALTCLKCLGFSQPWRGVFSLGAS